MSWTIVKNLAIFLHKFLMILLQFKGKYAWTLGQCICSLVYRLQLILDKQVNSDSISLYFPTYRIIINGEPTETGLFSIFSSSFFMLPWIGWIDTFNCCLAPRICHDLESRSYLQSHAFFNLDMSTRGIYSQRTVLFCEAHNDIAKIGFTLPWICLSIGLFAFANSKVILGNCYTSFCYFRVWKWKKTK